ncbi:MAG TPA: MFS transporter [Luteimonas sp.]|nr:MFS transporter [Luteimonas sp.]
MSLPTTTAGGPPPARVHAGEWPAVAVSFTYFFCVLAAYYMIRPVREQLSAAVGSTQLPWFYLATFVAMLLLAPVFGALVSRFPRRIVVPLLNLVFIACLLGFVPLFTQSGLLSPRALGVLFFVWVSVFNLFVVSVFWIFMTDIWSVAQSRRLFPLIALAGTCGAVAGPGLTRGLVGMIGVAPLLLVSASLLGVALGCVVWLGRWSRVRGTRRAPSDEAAVGGGMFDGLKQIFADPFMRNMALLLLLADGIGTVNYALVTDYSNTMFDDAVARTTFAANVDLATNVLTAVVQLTLTRWLLPRHGAGPTILVWALASTVMLGVVVVAADPYAPLLAGMPAVALALIVSRGLAYGMAEPARHSLFASVPRNIRYKGQNAVDTAVWRFGDVAIAVGMNVLRGVGATIGTFASLSAGAAVAAGVIGWRLSRWGRGGEPEAGSR